MAAILKQYLGNFSGLITFYVVSSCYFELRTPLDIRNPSLQRVRKRVKKCVRKRLMQKEHDQHGRMYLASFCLNSKIYHCRVSEGVYL